MVLIGEEEGKYYKLFWSTIDRSWFIASCNQKTLEVVTILPHYYNRWNIAQDTLERARTIAEPCKAPDTALPTKHSMQLPSVVKVIARLYNSQTQSFRGTTVCTFPVSEYGMDLDALAINLNIALAICEKLKSIMKPEEQVTMVILRLGSHVPIVKEVDLNYIHAILEPRH